MLISKQVHMCMCVYMYLLGAYAKRAAQALFATANERKKYICGD